MLVTSRSVSLHGLTESNFLRISLRKQTFKQNHFRLFIRGPWFMKWKNAKKSRDTAPLGEVASFFSKNFCWAKSRFTFPVCRRYSWTHYSRFLLKERGAEGWQHFNAILYWCPVRNNVNSERKCKLIFFFFPLFPCRRLIYSGPRIRQLICFANLGEFFKYFLNWGDSLLLRKCLNPIRSVLDNAESDFS